LPLAETVALLAGEGLPAHAFWPADANKRQGESA
jgi:hypothetical protein